ncbi:hypothetical protein M441DRAFT_362084 [Trichoderma asperellum CBS 433.97]|uniref:Uncharacterized protein n=1 Tax=Trichoderma asperellum (strain ATCC 204424 / CBS 433.97 / NBRC 101777) TaxID=1042311 RepID=A0A2T3ZDQ7_TRIA4|nr:hypothetical protein M441DRAFT_362084 [Trichoderma asperellum CBS 433.97]PTB42938.1 hypothetical protein M441DRAFT_362084 [Trichoderma asperellum CBS 433.97]
MQCTFLCQRFVHPARQEWRKTERMNDTAAYTQNERRPERNANTAAPTSDICAVCYAAFFLGALALNRAMWFATAAPRRASQLSSPPSRFARGQPLQPQRSAAERQQTEEDSSFFFFFSRTDS